MKNTIVVLVFMSVVLFLGLAYHSYCRMTDDVLMSGNLKSIVLINGNVRYKTPARVTVYDKYAVVWSAEGGKAVVPRENITAVIIE